VGLEHRLDDLQVYKRLHGLVEDLELTASRCHSLAAATACRATIALIRALASGLYKQSIEASVRYGEKLEEKPPAV
jgi:hypothetical protein